MIEKIYTAAPGAEALRMKRSEDSPKEGGKPKGTTGWPTVQKYSVGKGKWVAHDCMSYHNTPEVVALLGCDRLPEYCTGPRDAAFITHDPVYGTFSFHY